jgi:SPP1 family phage portal protein
MTENDRINAIIAQNKPITLKEMAQRDIARFESSMNKRDMLTGERYYIGEHDILRRRRTVIGEGGKQVEVENLPNNRVVDNIYRVLVDQKVNYLLGKPVTVRCTDEARKERLARVFTRGFFRLLRNIGEDVLNCGIGWLYVYPGADGRPVFKRFKPYEVIPVWADSEHTRLEYAIRVYNVQCFEGKRERYRRYAELYTREGVRRYLLEGGILKEDGVLKPYADVNGRIVIFDRVPLIAFRSSSKEIPLIKSVKTLQDGLNSLISDFRNCMEEDVRNTVLVIKNYDGEDLGQFRRNLSVYGAVKVKTIDGSQGGVETLSININADNYKAIIDIFKKAIFENGRGYNTKDDRLSSNPNQMNIMSMYNDIDIDANGMETEFAASLEQLFELLEGEGAADVEVVFNRSMIMNESEIIDNIIKSKGIVDDEILKSRHPWVK